MQGKLFPNFTSILFDYLFITWETNYVRNRGFWTCLSWFYRIDQELRSTLSRVGLSSEFSKYFDKLPLRILHDVLCRVFRFFKASFNALTSQLIEF